MARASGATNCEARPGSYYVSSDSSSPVTIYIHATGSGDPNGNGKTYEHNARLNGLNSQPYSGLTNGIIRGIWTRRNLDPNGSLVAQGYIEDCLATDGSKHNILVGGNSYLKGVVCSNAYYDPTKSGTMFVVNDDYPANRNVTYENCSVLMPSPAPNIDGFLAHGNLGGIYGTVKWINPRVQNVNSGIYSQCTNMVIIGGSISNVVASVGGASVSTYITNTVFNCPSNGVVRVLNPDCPITVISGCAFYANPQYQILGSASAGAIKVLGSVFNTATAPGVITTSSTNTDVLSYSNTFICPQALQLQTTNQYAGDYNYYTSSLPVTVDDIGGSKSLAQWKSLSGQDQNDGTDRSSLAPVPYLPNQTDYTFTFNVIGDARFNAGVELGGVKRTTWPNENGITNNQTGVTLSGTFSGNANGLTNIPGGQIVSGTVNSNALDTATAAQLALAGTGGTTTTNNALLTGTNRFSGTNIFAGPVQLTNLLTTSIIEIRANGVGANAAQFSADGAGTLRVGGHMYVNGDIYGVGTSSIGLLARMPAYFTTLSVNGASSFNTVTATNSATASNFVHSTWKWIDVLASGQSVASNPSGDPPILTEVPGQNYLGYGYYWLDKSYFSVQGPHKLANTNASNPALYFQPHLHVSTTNNTAGTNATFGLELYYGAVHGYLTNYYAATNTGVCTNIYGHYMINFGNVTNNSLINRSSVIWRGRVMRVDGGNGDIGNSSPVWVDSIDLHVPVQEFGTIGQNGD